MLDKFYAKETLFKSHVIKGNLRDLNQLFKLVYYPMTEGLVDKLALYMYLTDDHGEKAYSPRSIFFVYPGDVLVLIQELISAYLFFMGKRVGEEGGELSSNELLNGLVNRISKVQMEKIRR